MGLGCSSDSFAVAMLSALSWFSRGECIQRTWLLLPHCSCVWADSEEPTCHASGASMLVWLGVSPCLSCCIRVLVCHLELPVWQNGPDPLTHSLGFLLSWTLVSQAPSFVPCYRGEQVWSEWNGWTLRWSHGAVSCLVVLLSPRNELFCSSGVTCVLMAVLGGCLSQQLRFHIAEWC